MGVSHTDCWYGINEVSDITGISAFTIRYYDKCGFFPALRRNKRGVRSFSDSDIAQLYLVDSLRKSGLSIEGIQYYMKLDAKGSCTRSERLTILRNQEAALEYQYEELGESLGRMKAIVAELEIDHNLEHDANTGYKKDEKLLISMG